jgi:two-component system chemotaxis sensor kinase CheA
VKKAIEKLRGRVDIESSPGEGTKFIIRLPLTLAIIDGMIVRVGQEKFIIPTLSILESFVPREDQYFTVENKGEMLLARGGLHPLIRLDRLFQIPGDAAQPWEGLATAVEHDGDKVFLLFDEMLGKEEVVIKSLGGHLANTQGIAGCTIMGDGKVGLILDIPGMIRLSR